MARHARLFGFLTCKANAAVAPVHPKAMPAILTTEEDCDAWLTAPTEEALKLQRPLLNDALRVVMMGKREDEALVA